MAIHTAVDQRVLEKAPTITGSSETSGSIPTASTPSQTVISNIGPEPPTYYTTDGVVLYDNNGHRWGEIIDSVPVGDASFLTAIKIDAVLARVDNSTFTLPSRAQYVTDVWFDGLKAEPGNHYYFFPDDLINTVAAQAADVVVSALYLNKDEG